MMKQLKFLLVAAILFAGIQTATAQAKVAHINVQELLTNMPDMKNANAQLTKVRDAHEAELNKMLAEYEAKIKQYNVDADKITEAVYKTRMQEVEDMRNRIQEYDQSANKDVMQKQEELYKPIIDKSRTAIQKVAKAKGFEYVFDASQGKGLIVFDGPDLMADVKKELGF